jgi:acetyl esterase/lipase
MAPGIGSAGSRQRAFLGPHPPASAANIDHIHRKFLDVPYASLSPAHRLDIYLPDEGDGPFPVIVSIHGGAFLECDKADGQVMPMLEGLKRGYAVVAVNYRLSGEAKFPAQIQDVKAAVRWIRAEAGRYGFDPCCIAAWGGSAGGYLATMLGVTSGVKELEDPSLGNAEQSSDVQCVVDWYGPTNFLKLDDWLNESGFTPRPGMEHNAPHSPESLLLGEQITQVPDRVKAADPETYITPAMPPFFVQHGTGDSVIPVQCSIHLAARLAQVAGSDTVKLELLEGADHADPRFEAADNVQRVLDFLDKHLKRA